MSSPPLKYPESSQFSWLYSSFEISYGFLKARQSHGVSVQRLYNSAFQIFPTQKMEKLITFIKVSEVFFPERCYELRFTAVNSSELNFERFPRENCRFFEMPRDRLVIFQETLLNFIKWSLEINNSDWKDYVYPSLVRLEPLSSQCREMMDRRLEQMRELVALFNTVSIMLES